MLDLTDPESTPLLATPRTLLTAILVALGSVVLLTVALIAMFPTDLPLGEVRRILSNTNPMGLVAGLVVMTFGMAFVAIRWRALMPAAKDVGTPSLTGIVCAGLMLNYALPGPVGELGAAMLVRHRHGIPATTALAASVHARMIGLSLAGILAAITYLFAELPIPADHHDTVAIATICIATGATGLGLLSAFPGWIRKGSSLTLGAIATRLPQKLGKVAQRTHETVMDLADALAQTGRLGIKRYLAAAFWALAAHASVTVGIWLSCQAMGFNPYLPGVLFTYCAATAAVVALIAFPGSQVGWDAL
ncbi:MAG: lysylphosphatidylglycerol synthase transmembrane domain-containing protein [Myxococcota bacterium]|nr:lysylphosphatidylglycerol synthase transmembrane domain-containing protein [Myxococcota bacterium]